MRLLDFTGFKIPAPLFSVREHMDIKTIILLSENNLWNFKVIIGNIEDAHLSTFGPSGIEKLVPLPLRAALHADPRVLVLLLPLRVQGAEHIVHLDVDISDDVDDIKSTPCPQLSSQ